MAGVAIADLVRVRLERRAFAAADVAAASELESGLRRLESNLEAGDIELAAAEFDAVSSLSKQLFDRTEYHEITNGVLARGVEIFAANDQPERARLLAGECWRRVEYTASRRILRAQILVTLARFFTEYGPESRLEATRDRWRSSFPGRPWPLDAPQPPR